MKEDEPIPYTITPKGLRVCELMNKGHSMDEAVDIADAEFEDDGHTLRSATQ
jgi:hypothetical protein